MTTSTIFRRNKLYGRLLLVVGGVFPTAWVILCSHPGSIVHTPVRNELSTTKRQTYAETSNSKLPPAFESSMRVFADRMRVTMNLPQRETYKYCQYVQDSQDAGTSIAGHLAQCECADCAEKKSLDHTGGCPLTGAGTPFHAERLEIEKEIAASSRRNTAMPASHNSFQVPSNITSPQGDGSGSDPNDQPPIRLVQKDVDPITAQASEIASKENSDTPLSQVERYVVDQAHANVYHHDPYPSATKCATCHPDHFREWSVSPHAYAQLSPVFNAMSAKLNKLTNGTLGDFCIRCHTPTGMALNEPMIISNLDRHPSAREGVTCTVCHRINKAWGKGAGRQALVAADVTGPIYGTLGNNILARVLADPEQYGVLSTEPLVGGERSREIHSVAEPFFQLHTSGFCGACHDVFAPNGFRLEDAFSEFKSSPAALKKSQSCQDCHMGEVPGQPAGYRVAAIAKVGNVHTEPRKRTNHMMAGPDYSIVHPGLFPHNPEAIKEEHDAYIPARGGLPGLATMRQWLKFDHEAGWGTLEFERSDAAKALNEDGPEAWRDSAKRFRARAILDDQFELLSEYGEARRRILATGFELGEIQKDRAGGDGLRFRVLVSNGTDGHGVPTGFDAERVVFLRTIVWDANDKIVFVSGDLDPNGDIRDSHSAYVHNGKLPIDRQLFTLQSRFITRNIRGGEREQVLNVAFSVDPLPYIRPATRPFTVLGRPLGARKHKQNLEARDGKRWARYHVQASQLTGCGPYTVSVQLVAGMVPVNLVHEISDVGFDYDLSPREIAKRVVEGHLVLHERQAVLE